MPTPQGVPGSQTLLVQFLSDLLQRTMDVPSEAAFQHAVQTFCDDLRPWFDPADCAEPPRRLFTLWEDLHIDEEHDTIGAVFTPEGAAFFRAWLRRRGVDPWCGTS